MTWRARPAAATTGERRFVLMTITAASCSSARRGSAQLDRTGTVDGTGPASAGGNFVHSARRRRRAVVVSVNDRLHHRVLRRAAASLCEHLVRGIGRSENHGRDSRIVFEAVTCRDGANGAVGTVRSVIAGPRSADSDGTDGDTRRASRKYAYAPSCGDRRAPRRTGTSSRIAGTSGDCMCTGWPVMRRGPYRRRNAGGGVSASTGRMPK